MPVLALAASVARWLLQGSGNIFTRPSRRYYIPDPDLGWRVVHGGPVWLGLDLVAALAAAALAIAAAAWLIRRRERALERPWTGPRVGLWIAAALSLAVPLWAFASGLGPADARDQLPLSLSTTAGDTRVAPAGISGALPGLPAGTYRVLARDDEGSAITARVAAGGETFDTRFAGGLDGAVTLDPADLTRPIQAVMRVDAASVDTGIKTRSKHASEYLLAEEHPHIELSVVELLAAQQGAEPDTIDFWARARVALMGSAHDVTVTGALRALDRAARQRLGLTAPALVVTADFELDIQKTPLADDAGDFDTTTIPIHASLIVTLDRDAPTNHE